jgi:streptomycin 6-kinase
MVPELDDELRRRLGRRFGADVEPWFDRLPGVLGALAEEWQIEWGPLIRRGTVSVVCRCRMADGRPAVLKVSPDRPRITTEAAGLKQWTTPHSPAVYAMDVSVGAILMEAIEPGLALDESSTYPTVETVAELLTALHSAVADPSFPPLALRVAYLFEGGTADYRRHPGLAGVIPLSVYERGRRLAVSLAEDSTPAVLLHGDLTPVNIVDGGPRRGLVALDPAPCLGDAAFDTVDLLSWQAEDEATIAARVTQLAAATGADGDRMLGWCVAFAGMIALELAASHHPPADRIHAYLDLALQAPA